VIAEGEPERGRRRVLRLDGREIGLVILLEFLVMGNVTAVAIHFPTFGKHPQRDSGVVLDNDATVLQQEIAHAGESVAMHEE
jgi:hypothetical protein